MNTHRKHILGVIGGVLAAQLASPALAAGLPQLDIATFTPQLVWLAITFVVLYLLMSRIALPRIGQVIEERQHRIEDNLAKAETLRADAAEAEASYEAALAKARADAHSVMVEVHDQVASEAAAKLADLSAKLDDNLKQAEDRLVQEKEKALESLGEIATEVTRALTEQLTGGDVSDKDISKAVGTALEARQ
ncbi:MAG: F0F1 ATP synthase subunit B' [Rhodospirillaceae bacterium]|jgi:F-type H+-transporting ATPase subunit b|nr:F0F1 ATP synthase subunit B' [Rhodospirillaceae bacterium]MBT4219472.1 F0F1 ATP synthase subunit B' [Rhodospirillaceae bacterium]MBT4464483.1 F0F1 ATP synthase subunit B' [Rhodospirillaceae bacterium]MBT6406293.1 F0F1 ATP synthase subunit B' [Rhodospirillaceae bacterium]MBT7356743.1 F0F1 ATP synthase subunit B' [Rhodospirillaceae bacterium]